MYSLLPFVVLLLNSKMNTNLECFHGRVSQTLLPTLSTFSILSMSNDVVEEEFNLQRQHPYESPCEKMKSLATYCDLLDIHNFDTYGDFEAEKKHKSYIRRFESEMSQLFGKEDAVFMPSGTMAQSIALLIHSKAKNNNREKKYSFACHHTCHLLLHENDGYHHLLGMDALVISTNEDEKEMSSIKTNQPIKRDSIHVDPMRFDHVKDAFQKERKRRKLKPNQLIGQSVVNEKKEFLLKCLILELPHREIGGKLTPLNDIFEISKLCDEENIKFHCDGARFFEAHAGYNKKRKNGTPLSIADLAQPFDSIYISFYKGLGAISGAMLLGDAAFCSEARTWLRRFGGNLYTLLPYYVSSWAGYHHQVKLRSTNVSEEIEHESDLNGLLTFQGKVEKMTQIVQNLSQDKLICEFLTFEPLVPDTNMVHIYISNPSSKKVSITDLEKIRDDVKLECGIIVFERIREIKPESDKGKLGYCAYLEVAMGDGNGNISNSVFWKGWKEFVKKLIALA